MARPATGPCEPGAVPPGFRLLLSPRGSGGDARRPSRERSRRADPARYPPPSSAAAGAAGRLSGAGRGRGPALPGPRILRGRRWQLAPRPARPARDSSFPPPPRRPPQPGPRPSGGRLRTSPPPPPPGPSPRCGGVRGRPAPARRLLPSPTPGQRNLLPAAGAPTGPAPGRRRAARFARAALRPAPAAPGKARGEERG